MDQLHFDQYPHSGRQLLGRPQTGDSSARHGYAWQVLEYCGYRCAYCGLDFRTFEAWLQLSVDHVIPRNSIGRGFDPRYVEDEANLVACCRPCNDFGNRFEVTEPPPQSDDAFFDLRDAVFERRRSAIIEARDRERVWFETNVRRLRT